MKLHLVKILKFKSSRNADIWLKLLLGQDYEDEICSRFFWEIVKWPKEVSLVTRTQPSGPLCVWQCLNMQGNNNVTYMAWWQSGTLYSQNLKPCHKKRNTALDNTRKSGDVLVVRNNLPEVGPVPESGDSTNGHNLCSTSSSTLELHSILLSPILNSIYLFLKFIIFL